jgi:hypothetical protein
MTSGVQHYLDAVAHLKVSGGTSLVTVILFGSTASGGVSESSDVDLIIVLPDEATAADRRRVYGEVAELEIAHGLRMPVGRPKNALEKFAEHAGGDGHACFVCTRGDLLSGDVARVFSLRAAEALFVDRIVLASVIVSAKTVWGEDLLPLVVLPAVRRLDVFKSLFGLAGLMMLSAGAFPVLPDATRYAMGALKHSLHSCYFCYHLRTAPLSEEVAFFSGRLGGSRALEELLEQRRAYRRSFGFVLQCVPALLRLHMRTAWEVRFPRAVRVFPRR